MLTPTRSDRQKPVPTDIFGARCVAGTVAGWPIFMVSMVLTATVVRTVGRVVG